MKVLNSPSKVVKYSFNELSENAKEKAREWWRTASTDDEWWDSTYEDAIECAKQLGIAIEEIQFSGFWSQGDGASFTGWYRHAPNAIANIKAYAPKDETLLEIAEILTVRQLRSRLLRGEYFTAYIERSASRYVHSHTMHATVNAPDDYTSLEDELTDIFRRFADWIYRQLEQEYEWLQSDEVIDSLLIDNGYEFDEDGDVL